MTTTREDIPMRRTNTRAPQPTAAQRRAKERHDQVFRSLQHTHNEEWRRRIALTVDYLRSELAKLDRLAPEAAQGIADRMADALLQAGADAADLAGEVRN